MPLIRLRHGLPLLVATAALAVPSAANASTVSVEGTTLVITGAATDVVRMTTAGSDVFVEDPAGVTGCPAEGGSATKVRCARPTATRVDLGGGDDKFEQFVDGIADVVNGGDGNDTLFAFSGIGVETSPAVDVVNGGEGDDTLFAGSGSGTVCNGDGGDDRMECSRVPAGQVATQNGGPGADSIVGGDSNDAINGDSGSDTRLSGGKGNDVIHGGEGDDGNVAFSDGITGGPGADDIFGDAGTDRLREERDENRKQIWSLDDLPNDGADTNGDGNADEGDNVHADIENVTTGFDDDVITGSAAANVPHAGTTGSDIVSGGAGDDTIDAGGGGGGDRDTVDAGDGNDTLTGAGALAGGAGNDKIDGSGGDDVIDAGPGVDTVSALSGNDLVRAVDATGDRIGCGVGADVAEIDSIDVINADAGDLCETTRVTATPVTPGVGDGSAGGGQNPAPPAGAAVELVLRATGTIRRSTASFSVTAPGAGKVSATVTIGSGAKATAARVRTLGKATKTVSRAGKTTLKVKLKGKAYRSLRRKRSFKVTLTTRFTPKGGTRGPATKRSVKLKRRS